MFYFRADANKAIATGHIMRCMSIADELKKHGINSTFITANREADILVQPRGFKSICLGTYWDKMEEEIDKLIALIKAYDIKKLLIDSYYVTDNYLKEISKYTKIIYLDDLGTIKYPVNTIINYSNYAETLGYQERFSDNSVNLILGSQYVPLREEFQLVKPIFRKTVRTILISTGGGDTYNIAGSLLKKISDSKQHEKFHFIIISGKFNKNYEELKNQCKILKNITIIQDVQEMSKVMLAADVSITAGGSTMYELCACEVPMLIFTFADNQMDGANDFAKRNAAFYVGDVRTNQERVVSQILDKILFLSSHREERYQMVKNAVSIVNKNGVSNLVEKIKDIG